MLRRFMGVLARRFVMQIGSSTSSLDLSLIIQRLPPMAIKQVKVDPAQTPAWIVTPDALLQNFPDYDPATQTVRIDKLKQDAQAAVDTFGAQLRKAAAAAGLNASQPITITESTVNAQGVRDIMVDPSATDAAKIKALIDNSPALSLAYANAVAPERLANMVAAGMSYARANGHATTPAQANAVYQQLNSVTLAAVAQPVSIKV
jgi:hypothetical protein